MKSQSEQITEQLLRVLTEIQKLKKQHKGFEYYKPLEINLINTEKLTHDLTLSIIKNQPK